MRRRRRASSSGQGEGATHSPCPHPRSCPCSHPSASLWVSASALCSFWGPWGSLGFVGDLLQWCGAVRSPGLQIPKVQSSCWETAPEPY